MLYAVCNPMHPLYGALPQPYLPARCGLHVVLCSHIDTHACVLPRCRTLLYSRNFIPMSVSLWNDLSEYRACIQCCGTGGFEELGQCLIIGLAAGSIFCTLLISFSLLSFMGWYRCVGVFEPRER